MLIIKFKIKSETPKIRKALAGGYSNLIIFLK